MAHRAIIVTDLGYGDAGKGTMVDYLVRQAPSAVIRHNGGAQAAHNVVLPDGRHHAFSQFGSGSYLNDVPTYLSRYMLVNPLHLFTEAEQLHQQGVRNVFARLAIDEAAMVVTPWHMLVNQLREIMRGAERHGSCGHGVGEAMADAIDHPELTIRIRDLFSYSLPAKLNEVRYHKRTQAVKLATTQPEAQALLAEFDNDDVLQMTVDVYRALTHNVRVVDGDYLHYLVNGYEQLVFEGAQGVLLDEWYGFHPYTTWSTTTHHNALCLLDDIAYTGDVTRLGVVRSYMTRHGAGPFVTEDAQLVPYLAEPHNGNNRWQHGFRVGYPDIVALRYALEVAGGVDALAITHLDQAGYMNQVAVGYRTLFPFDTALFDGMNGVVTRIIPGGSDELDRQSAITQALMSAQPQYQQLRAVTGASGAEGIVTLFTNELALPVCYTSYGPTWADKQALVAC